MQSLRIGFVGCGRFSGQYLDFHPLAPARAPPEIADRVIPPSPVGYGGQAEPCFDDPFPDYGGGIFDGTATDCVFEHNLAYYGGGMHQGTAIGCTFVNNAATGNGDGIFVGTALNCILWDNGFENLNGTAATNCCAPDVDPGVPGNITNGWEDLYYGSETGCVATGNTDPDPHDNLSEYIAGTVPTDSNSFFRITNAWPSASGFVVEWEPCASNRWYSVVWTNDLTGAFTSIVSGIDFPQNSYTDTVNGAASEGFYRIEVALK